jgi:trehalose/maltose hydrolase-like predicted phosphorylase
METTIVFGRMLEQMYLQSGDEGWLKLRAAPAITGIGEFFASRMVRCAAPKNSSLFCLDHVMGPDEKDAPVNNSGFTSVRARATR